MIGLYNTFFRFPELDFRLSVAVVAGSLGGSAVVGALGAQAAVRRAVRIPPAEAMRPGAAAALRGQRHRAALGAAARVADAHAMIIRSLERQPVRAGLSIVGVAMAVAVLFVGFAFIDVMRRAGRRSARRASCGRTPR